MENSDFVNVTVIISFSSATRRRHQTSSGNPLASCLHISYLMNVIRIPFDIVIYTTELLERYYYVHKIFFIHNYIYNCVARGLR